MNIKRFIRNNRKLIVFLSVFFSVFFLARSIDKHSEIYSGKSTLPIDIVFKQKVSYTSFNSFQGGLADSYGRISVSPSGKALMFYDFQVKEPKTHIVYLDSGKQVLVDEGRVWAYGWSNENLVLAKELNFQTQMPEKTVLFINSETGRTESSFIKNAQNAQDASPSGRIQISTDNNTSVLLTEQGLWGAVSFQINGDRAFYGQKIYSPNGKYYMQMKIKSNCFLDCSYSVEALEFFRANGDKVGEYDVSEYRVLSKTYFSDSWAPDNSFIVFDRSLADPIVPTQYASEYYTQRLLGMGRKLTTPYTQIWTVKKIRMPE